MALKKFAISTIVLIMAGLIVRLLGFVYRIYLSSMIGAEGMGLYQLVIPLYSLIVLTLTSGVSITASRMIAAEVRHDPAFNTSRIVKAGMCISCVGGAVVSLFLLIFVDQIATHILGDSRTILSIKVLIPCVPVIAAAAALKGYYYGVQRVLPAAGAQVVEQMARIGFVAIFASYADGIGIEHLCALAIGAGALGEGANLAVLMLAYPLYTRKSKKEKQKMSRSKTLIYMFKESMPISINRLITSAMSAVEMILIPQRLIAGGLTYKIAIEQFGLMSGMAMPLLMFPSLVTSSLSTSLVAEISANTATGDYSTANARVTKAISLTFIMGVLFTVLFQVMPDEIAGLAFRWSGVGDMLKILSYGCMLLYLMQTLTGVMNGLGLQNEVLIISLIGYAIRIAFIFFFVPQWGVPGYAIGMVASLVVVCICFLVKIMKVTKLKTDIKNWLAKPLTGGILIFFSYKYIRLAVQWVIGFEINAKIETLVIVAASCFLYFCLLVSLGMGKYFMPRSLVKKRK